MSKFILKLKLFQEVNKEMSFEPRILGFLCNWCSYAGADLAGVSRIQYPHNIRVIRVMCSGRVAPRFIFKALQEGADGVIVMGCHPGDCHYLEGNYEAEKKFIMVLRLLESLKNKFEYRVRLEWVSASEGTRFGEVVTDFTNQVRELGPTPLSGANPDENLGSKLKAMEMAASSERLRTLVGRQRKVTEEENVFGDQIDSEEYIEMFEKAIQDEYERQQILLALEKESKSVKDLGVELQIDPSVVLEHILILKYRMLVDFQEIIGNTPIFMRL
jgi:F420-non-reducing hydrogenase iron-sulfur subunit